MNAGYSGDKLRVAARTNDPEAIKNLVAGGLGISMISSKAAEDYSRENRVLVFGFPEISGRRQFYIATRKHVALPASAERFLRFVKAFYDQEHL
jgi:DNA-binding transcriptional LysR family regulator